MFLLSTDPSCGARISTCTCSARPVMCARRATGRTCKPGHMMLCACPHGLGRVIGILLTARVPGGRSTLGPPAAGSAASDPDDCGAPRPRRSDHWCRWRAPGLPAPSNAVLVIVATSCCLPCSRWPGLAQPQVICVPTTPRGSQYSPAFLPSVPTHKQGPSSRRSWAGGEWRAIFFMRFLSYILASA